MLSTARKYRCFENDMTGAKELCNLVIISLPFPFCKALHYNVHASLALYIMIRKFHVGYTCIVASGNLKTLKCSHFNAILFLGGILVSMCAKSKGVVVMKHTTFYEYRK